MSRRDARDNQASKWIAWTRAPGRLTIAALREVVDGSDDESSGLPLFLEARLRNL